MDGDWQAEQIAFQDVMKPHAHSDWSLMLPRGLVEAQREERAQGLQNTYCSLVFAGQDTKYARGWLGSSSSPQASARRGRDKLDAIHHPYPKKTKRRGEKRPFHHHKEDPKFNFLGLEKKTLGGSPLVWVMPGELFSACVYLPIPLIPFVIMVQVRYWNAQCRV